jgi:hypothetical protein
MIAPPKPVDMASNFPINSFPTGGGSHQCRRNGWSKDTRCNTFFPRTRQRPFSGHSIVDHPERLINNHWTTDELTQAF